MIDPSFELQAALVGLLRGTGALPAGVKVYDQAPDDAAFPYLTIGDCQVLPDKSGCIDGVEVYPQIDVWTRTTGYGETKTIARAVTLLLDDQPIVVDGFNVVFFEVQSVNYLRDPDGLTRHAAITFHGNLTPA
jgi:hypothetical protein